MTKGWQSMTIRELYEKAEKYNLLDEKVEDVQEYISLGDSAIKRGVCANCGRRKTDLCSFPFSKLTDPLCFYSKPIEK